ncbi:hypothetical protein [uncultured Roseobacter sp.]|uniref:hypothetical protein n=1 Tax=uncultured Roseobacter sp. TaxID=114847 RepID=UPI00260C1E36|nr:hypothetical protein [uncultured Roseobacter sp.]
MAIITRHISVLQALSAFTWKSISQKACGPLDDKVQHPYSVLLSTLFYEVIVIVERRVLRRLGMATAE